MASVKSLDDLCYDVLVCIMEEFSCPYDLYRLKLASPACYRADDPSPGRLTRNVLKYGVPPGILYHAIAALVASRRFPYQLNPMDWQAVSFFHKYLEGTLQVSFPTTREDLFYLNRLYCRISFFVHDYSTKARRAMGEQQTSVESLSKTERTRLYRAFFLYEVVSRFHFGRNDGRNGMFCTNAYMQRLAFHFRSRSWLLEEMACIHFYYCSMLEHHVKMFEDEFVEAVLQTPGARISATRRIPPPHSWTMDDYYRQRNPLSSHYTDYQPINNGQFCDTGFRDFLRIHGSRLSLFSKNPIRPSLRPEHILAARGCNFVHRITYGSPELRKQLFRGEAFDQYITLTDFLSVAHTLIPFTLPRQHQCSWPIPVEANENVMFPSQGVQFFMSPAYSESYAQTLMRQQYEIHLELKRRGYAFWDGRRLSANIINLLPLTQEMFALPKDSVRSLGWISAQDRLMGVVVPKEELHRLEDEFGSTNMM
ncbi:hypothetical protein HIM_05781 [Hirsutella minnesotensis 3608]|uniref:Uncharacterized protein n=1 Tax=Hirsutella minnesotensis 3608 TaxID=1043627 RepID=A0A0F7ZZX7_9HYPO|nr:hypothetical protein HIM_05781 [Hirsutella minnesotensis 3608]